MVNHKAAAVPGNHHRTFGQSTAGIDGHSKFVKPVLINLYTYILLGTVPAPHVTQVPGKV